jgi:hypothetical protein
VGEATTDRSGVRGHHLCPGGVLGLVLLLAGCAYSFSGSGLPAHIKTIAIPNAENKTLEPTLSQEVTAGVIDQFIKDGRLKLASENQAACMLSVRIDKYENKVNNYGPDNTPKDYIVVLTVAVVLRDQVKNRDLWKDDALIRTSVYVPGGTGSAPATEASARQDAIGKVARELISRTMEQW